MESFDRTFCVKDYKVDLQVRNEGISVKVAEKDTGNAWRGNFSAQFIEELSGKTGNFKKFAVFVRMLISGFEKSSQSIVIDLLTLNEFDKIRNSVNPHAEEKLLLIMTYIGEFDKVHYPLPLPTMAKRYSLPSLEVETLRNELKDLRSVKDEKEVMQKRLEGLICEKDKQIYYLQSEKEDLQNELDRIKNQMDRIIEQLEAQALLKANPQNDLQKQKEKAEIQAETCKKELKRAREDSKRDKARIFQLESELKALFDKSTAPRAKSFTGKSSESTSEIAQKILRLKSLLNRAKES